MSSKHGLLALLSEGPAYGAALKADFEQRTGHTQPVPQALPRELM